MLVQNDVKYALELISVLFDVGKLKLYVFRRGVPTISQDTWNMLRYWIQYR